ncbi:MAG TPA: hemerythrin domain-containing protein [Polyangia bacterium]|jgi:hemerythrin-like domain-containing protein
MLTQIRAPRPDPGREEDAVDLLTACHERIRAMTALAGRLAAGATAPPAQIAEAAARLARYFGESLPLHSEDEDASIRPRLDAAGAPAEVAAALAVMSAQHEAIHARLAMLAPAWREVAADPARLAEHAATLTAGAGALADLFGPHLALEEATIFPAIRAVLDPAAQRAVLAEMRARR